MGSLEKLESHDTREQARKEIITLVQQELTQETLPLVLKARTGMQGSSLTSRWNMRNIIRASQSVSNIPPSVQQCLTRPSKRPNVFDTLNHGRDGPLCSRGSPRSTEMVFTLSARFPNARSMPDLSTAHKRWAQSERVHFLGF